MRQVIVQLMFFASGIATAATLVPMQDAKATWPAVRPGYIEAPVREKPRTYPFEKPQKLLKRLGIESKDVIAGSKVKFAYVFEGKAPDFGFKGQINIAKGRPVVWSDSLEFTPEKNVVDFGDGTWQLSFEYAFPSCFNDGDYGWGLEIGGLCGCAGYQKDASYPYPSGSVSLKRLACLPGFERPVRCEIKDVNGAPEFFIDGKLTFPLWGVTHLGASPDGRHSDMPLNVLSVWSNSYDWHPETNRFDSSVFDRYAEIYSRAHPDAYFVWDLTVYPPKDWKAAHPEELIADEDGNRKPYAWTDYSFASRKAMDVMRGEVEEAIRYLEGSPYANKIIAYRISSGETPEWLAYRPFPDKAYDFSKPSAEAFRAWCRTHYPELKDPHPTAKAEHLARDNGDDLLWDRGKHLMTAAFWEFYSDVIADDCIELNRLAKGLLGGRKPVGTYHGYTYFLGSTGNWQHRGLFAYKKVLDSGAVDFVCSPQGYSKREPGSHFADMKPFATNRRHGVLNATENDMRTHNSPPRTNRYGQTVCEEHTVMCFRRDMATELCRRNPFYYYPIAAGTSMQFPAMAEEGRIFRTLGQYLLDTGAPRRKAEIALVASDRACVSIPVIPKRVSSGEIIQAYETNGVVRVGKQNGRTLLSGDIFVEGLDRWARAGAPVDYLLAEDLKDNPGDYRLYVFLNAFIYDEDLRKAVDRLRRRGATILWQYAPGWATGTESGTACMKALTGIDFDRVERALPPEAKMEDGRMMGLPDIDVRPLFTPKGDFETLGTYANGQAAVAKFAEGAAKTYFSGTWQLDVPFIRQVVRDSGAFVYTDAADAIEANERLFMLHAKQPGVKHVRLPRKTTVLDVFEKRIVAVDADAFDFYASLFATHLFYLGDDAEMLLGKL